MNRFSAILAALFLVLLSFFPSILPSAQPLFQPSTEPILKIGGLFALTGPHSLTGQAEEQGAMLLAEKINNSGTSSGMRVELVTRDTKGLPEQTLAMAKELVAQGVAAIIGPSTTVETMAIRDFCTRSQVLLVSGATGEQIASPVLFPVFRIPPSDRLAAGRIFFDMKARGITRIGILTANSAYGQAGKILLEKLAPDFGIKIAAAESFDAKSGDFVGVLEIMSMLDVQAIVNWAFDVSIGIIPKNMRELGMKQLLYQSPGYADLLASGSSDSGTDGVLFPAGRLYGHIMGALKPGSTDSRDKIVHEFIESFRAKYGEMPSYWSGYGYDALLVVLEAAGRTARAGHVIEGKTLSAAVEGIRDLVGLSGVYNFSEKAHAGLDSSAFEIYAIKNGFIVHIPPR